MSASNKAMATGQQIAGLAATNAAEHDTLGRILDDHEIRIKVLEAP